LLNGVIRQIRDTIRDKITIFSVLKRYEIDKSNMLLVLLVLLVQLLVQLVLLVLLVLHRAASADERFL
jgi:hypothetical protein